MGTPHYMSPEQCHGKAVDHRTDIYAMGVMLYQLYSGRLPFSGETFAEILAKQIIDTPPPPSTYAQIPAELDKLIMKCLAKDPAGRPQSAKELGQLLGSILAGAAARVQRAAGQPTSATTLSASAIEVRRRERETEVAPRKSGKRTAVVGTSIGVGVALTIGVAVIAGRGHAPAPQAAAVQVQTAAPVAAPPAAPPAPTPVAPTPPAEAPTPAASEVAAAKKHHAGKPGRRDDESAPAAPGRPRSRASDTGLVTHNPFE
jgi:hypothetical protein